MRFYAVAKIINWHDEPLIPWLQEQWPYKKPSTTTRLEIKSQKLKEEVGQH